MTCNQDPPSGGSTFGRQPLAVGSGTPDALPTSLPHYASLTTRNRCPRVSPFPNPFFLSLLVSPPELLLLPNFLKYCCSLKYTFLILHRSCLSPCRDHLVTQLSIPPVYSTARRPSSPGDAMHASTHPKINPSSCPLHIMFPQLHALIRTLIINRIRQATDVL